MKQADIILSGKNVFTGLESQPVEASIAIKENKIVEVGTKEALKSYIGPDTKTHHFEEELIMAGFFDAHVHLMLGSLFNDFSINLEEVTSEEEGAIAVQAFAESNQDTEWVIGYGWDHTGWERKGFPSKVFLDRFIPNRPVVLFHAEGHYVWVNSKALKLAGITKETEHPLYGEIQKDNQGEPTGLLIESAMAIVTDIALDLPVEKQQELFQLFLKHAANLGVTSVNDLYASRSLEKLGNYKVFKAFENQEKLTARINLYPVMDEDLTGVKEKCRLYNSEKLKIAGLKQFLDGVVTGHTAYMLDPYLDNPETSGEPAFDLEKLKEWSIEADKAGLQIRFHAIGDRAVRTGLDIFEAAQKANGTEGRRHSLEHVEVIHPEDLLRFKELGVIASIQPIHLALMPRTSHTARIGEEKHPYTYPAKTLQDAGARLAFGTDFPIAPLNPMLGIYQAVTRMDYYGDYPWNEQEKLTLAEALKSYTIQSAYDTHREDVVGTIESGKLADIVVLDKNLFTIDKEKIKETKVALTIMDGKIIYEA